MEFYPKLLNRLMSAIGRFNSQRDGILRYRSSKVQGAIESQFPTGWNSTDLVDSYHSCSVEVSIPNGMEFYTARNRYEEENSGFNSQRDGILR